MKVVKMQGGGTSQLLTYLNGVDENITPLTEGMTKTPLRLFYTRLRPIPRLIPLMIYPFWFLNPMRENAVNSF